MEPADRPDAAVRRAAEAIRAWLEENPDAAETMRGIVEWWLMQQRFTEAWQTVEQALDQLVAEGVVKVTRLPGGDSLYSSAAAGDEDC